MRLCSFFLVLFSLWSPSVWAGEDDDVDDLSENTLTGRAPLTPAVTDPVSPTTGASDEDIRAWMNRPYAAASYRAAEALGIEVELAEAVHKVCELLYVRNYPEAKKYLDELSTKYPTLGLGPLGHALIYQALMFENYDYRYEKQYKQSYDTARAQLDKGLKVDGNEALENIVLTGILGVEAIHVMRKGEFLAAVGKALEAMKALENVRKKAPTLPDLKMVDGMYMYWRAAVSLSSKAIPDFPDRRAEGIALMQEAEKTSYYVGPASSLALAYSYIEERQLKLALDRCLLLRVKYADNVINNMTLGRIYTSMKRYDDALRIYDEVKKDATSNQRVYYQVGLVYYHMGRYPDALKEFQTYVGFKEVPTDARATAWYRIGIVYSKQHKPTEAKAAHAQAVKLNGHEGSKRAIARIEAREAEKP
jgi:tetratricopeptide (TPR) repeat protein